MGEAAKLPSKLPMREAAREQYLCYIAASSPKRKFVQFDRAQDRSGFSRSLTDNPNPA